MDWLPVKRQSYCLIFSFLGLLADKLGSYVVPFCEAGGTTIAGAFIPFALLCRKRSDRVDLILQNDEDEKLLK